MGWKVEMKELTLKLVVRVKNVLLSVGQPLLVTVPMHKSMDVFLHTFKTVKY